ncbi:hypothetical protein ASPTUDRAFT_40040 [Aspergillus tubingensis CBS 134.48]|uniref:Uncharacterized protein n=1 Tax=Aspergillus tubingensis (strain CBS 134.48) TaxID=767770 RepID=A0A1L9NCH9_ASPTC|nr:hypothetical protein ASPTUDRAFT_40040 [Aspergillus tubingensis CBS 134.48]
MVHGIHHWHSISYCSRNFGTTSGEVTLHIAKRKSPTRIRCQAHYFSEADPPFDNGNGGSDNITRSNGSHMIEDRISEAPVGVAPGFSRAWAFIKR